MLFCFSQWNTRNVSVYIMHKKELKKAIVLLEIHMKFRDFTRVKCQLKHLYASEYLRSISTFGSHSDIFILEFFMEA